MISEYRKEYLRNWRKKNRPRLRDYFRNYIKQKPKSGKLLCGYAGSSGLGRKYELLALKLLKGSKDCNKETFSGGWDIEWNGLKIDVKVRNLNKDGFYLFSKKPTCKADFFLCFLVDKKVKYILLIPKEDYKPIALVQVDCCSQQHFMPSNRYGPNEFINTP